MIKPQDRYENLILALLEQHVGIEDPISYPIGLVLDPSSACDLRCPFCIHCSSPPLRSSAIMQMELFEKIVDELGRYLFEVWLFNWGEPLLNRHLSEMVRSLKGHGDCQIRISSNLSLDISDDTIDELVKSGLDALTVSIDGITQESYEKYRVKGDLGLALSNMERFAKAKQRLGKSTPLIDWQFLVFSHNENELKMARECAERMGVYFRAAAPSVDMKNCPDWVSSLDEYVKEIYKKKKKAEDPESKQTAKEGIQERMELLSNRYYKGCDWHYLFGVINANGSVSPCCAIKHEALDFGRLDARTFKEIWTNEAFRSVRRYLKNGSYDGKEKNVCTNCYDRNMMDYAQYIVRSALLNAPHEVKEKARRLLPDNPLIKELPVELPMEQRLKSPPVTPLRVIRRLFGKR
jgi:radical SAM protein with 4Fe4S-binding SPASM domain